MSAPAFEPKSRAAVYRAMNLPAYLDVVAYLCIGHVEQFPIAPELPSRDGHVSARWPGQSMMESLAFVAYLEENLCPC